MSDTIATPTAVEMPDEFAERFDRLSDERKREVLAWANAASVENVLDHAREALAIAATLADLRNRAMQSSNYDNSGYDIDVERGLCRLFEDAYCEIDTLSRALPADVHNLRIIEKPGEAPEVR